MVVAVGAAVSRTMMDFVAAVEMALPVRILVVATKTVEVDLGIVAAEIADPERQASVDFGLPDSANFAAAVAVQQEWQSRPTIALLKCCHSYRRFAV